MGDCSYSKSSYDRGEILVTLNGEFNDGKTLPFLATYQAKTQRVRHIVDGCLSWYRGEYYCEVEHVGGLYIEDRGKISETSTSKYGDSDGDCGDQCSQLTRHIVGFNREVTNSHLDVVTDDKRDLAIVLFGNFSTLKVVRFIEPFTDVFEKSPEIEKAITERYNFESIDKITINSTRIV